MAAECPRAFVAVLATILGTMFAAAALAAVALLSGPVGVELQKPFLAFPVSRLTALQLCAALALVCGSGFVFLVAAWDRAPGWLRLVCGARWFGRAFDPLQGQRRSAPPWLFWICSGASILWASWAMLVSLPVVPFVEPDTISYLRPSPIRSSGYMLFLDAVVGVTGDLKWVVPLQLEAMLLSFLALGWAVEGGVAQPSRGDDRNHCPLAQLRPADPRACRYDRGDLRRPDLSASGRGALRTAPSELDLVDPGGADFVGHDHSSPNGISFLAGIPVLLLLYPRRWRMVTLATLGPGGDRGLGARAPIIIRTSVFSAFTGSRGFRWRGRWLR